jgi:hypothetical protein
MVEVFCQSLKLSSCQLLLILLGLDSLYLPILFQLLSKLLIFLLQISELLSTHIEVVFYLPDIESSEYFLDEGGLLIVKSEAFSIKVFSSLRLELLPGVVGPEVCLDGDGRSLFPQKFLAFDVHFELRLDLQGSCVISFPVFLAFVGPEVVNFLDTPQ